MRPTRTRAARAAADNDPTGYPPGHPPQPSMGLAMEPATIGRSRKHGRRSKRVSSQSGDRRESDTRLRQFHQEQSNKTDKRDSTGFLADPHINFTNVRLDEVINESIHDKSITVKATYDRKPTIVRLEKTQFHEDALREVMAIESTLISRKFVNDCYYSYMLYPTNLLNDIKVTVIHPASDSQIAKYTRSKAVFMNETPELYSDVIKPFLGDQSEKEKGKNDWVYNIIEGRSEADRVYLNDPDPDTGFMLVKDLKWSGEEKDLYVVAICHRRDIGSLRDLRGEHLSLLQNIMTKGTKAIQEKHEKMLYQIRTFIHYPPSFYHFHVHFKAVDACDYTTTDRDHLLSTVINNLKIDSDYYKKSTLTYPLSIASPLYEALEKAK